MQVLDNQVLDDKGMSRMTSVCPECEAQWPSTSGSGMCVGRRVRIGALARGLRVYVGALVWHSRDSALRHIGTSLAHWWVGALLACLRVAYRSVDASAHHWCIGTVRCVGVSARQHVGTSVRRRIGTLARMHARVLACGWGCMGEGGSTTCH